MKEQNVVEIEQIIAKNQIFYAHRNQANSTSKNSTEEKAPELLKEHTDRCYYYFKQLYRDKNLKDIFENFQKEFLSELSEQGEELFYKMLVNTVIFHDLGKINPAFQQIRMRNHTIKSAAVSCLDGPNHSLLSAAIYIDYFFEEIQKDNLSQEEKESLHVLMLANAYVISRHHGNLTPFENFLQEFYEGGKLYGIFEGMQEGEFSSLYQGPFYKKGLNKSNLSKRNQRYLERFFEGKSLELSLYTYIRFLFSILVFCDYYATTEYENGIRITDFGNVKDIHAFNDQYEQSELLKSIRAFHPDAYEDDGKDINILRKCMFYEVEQNLMKHKQNRLYYIEAPTGGGKSNLAMNCSFKLLNERIKKIIYVYPFNTLVEQNYDSLEKIFGNTDIFKEIAVINSITPIKMKSDKNRQFMEDSEKEENIRFYQQALLDRQFLNYPFILTTHVNLFQMMFGSEREAAISFYQLSGSVIVLDEIQSYKNIIWTEIMMFLECYSRLLNMKVIIMSATLPRLDMLTGNKENVVHLIQNPSRYFEDSRFKGRVKICYDLLHSDQKTDIEELYTHILNHAGAGRKILVEFIKKKQAEDFYWKMKEGESSDFVVLCMTGDDNQIDRKRILKQISKKTDQGIVLIATQVVEAGVDIDMDIGYKDISKLDSDEQFLGRINRNFKRDGVTYFFNLDNAQTIYSQDFRMNRQYTLQEEKMKEILEKKDFHTYYDCVLKALQNGRNSLLNEKGISYFIKEQVGKLDFVEVSERMRLIEDDQWDLSVYLARVIEDEQGNKLNGMELWNRYKELLMNQTMEYARKQVELSEVRSKMNYFIYRIRKNSDLLYSDRIGELYCIEDAEKYFENGRLNKELLISQGAIFVDML